MNSSFFALCMYSLAEWKISAGPRILFFFLSLPGSVASWKLVTDMYCSDLKILFIILYVTRASKE